MTIGGGIGREHSVFITRAWCRKASCWKHPIGARRNTQVTDVDRDLLAQWYIDHGAEALCGSLIDANYCSDAETEAATPALPDLGKAQAPEALWQSQSPGAL